MSCFQTRYYVKVNFERGLLYFSGGYPLITKIILRLLVKACVKASRIRLCQTEREVKEKLNN